MRGKPTYICLRGIAYVFQDVSIKRMERTMTMAKRVIPQRYDSYLDNFFTIYYHVLQNGVLRDMSGGVGI